MTLIEVPSILELLGITNVKPYIRAQLLAAGLSLPDSFDAKTVDLTGLYVKTDEAQLVLL